MGAEKRATGLNTAVGPNGATRTMPEGVARRVWVAAGGRCTLCNRYLLEDEFTGQPVPIGQLAHIVGWTDTSGSPRGSDELKLAERNDADNLMLLCHDQHKVIDSRSLWDVYTAEELRTFKRTHEHRIRRLTALTEKDSSTVLRVVGTVQGIAAALTKPIVASTLLAAGRFPDYALAGVDELEIDLRRLPGEGSSNEIYFAAGIAHLEASLGRLNALIATEKVGHLSVFPLARVPLLVALGALLDDTIPTEIYPKRRDTDESWGWTTGASVVEFEHRSLQEAQCATSVAVIFSLSGTVDQSRLPAESLSKPRYEVVPKSAKSGPDLISSRASLDNFAGVWRALLAEFEQRHPGLESIDVFAAAPVTAAVTIGRARMRAIHPRLRVYDRDTTNGGYNFALEVGL